MNAIGGFFELEMPHHGTSPHPGAVALSTGRACLSVMLEAVRPARVHVPFYTCDATLSPFARLGVDIVSYGLDERLLPAGLPALEPADYLLWTDYFGVCGEQTERLKQIYGDRLLIDDTHNFFREGHPGYWSFTSARKYFGVPDGAFLYSPDPISVRAERFDRISLAHGLLRRIGRGADAYAAYQSYEQSLGCEIHRISEISEGLLKGVDAVRVAAARRENFLFFHSQLDRHNRLRVPVSGQVPFCYPYLPQRPLDRRDLHACGFFVPCLWPDIAARPDPGFSFERMLAAELLPLPIDHRYTPADLARLLDYLLERA